MGSGDGEHWLETLEIICWIIIITKFVIGAVVLGVYPNVDLHDGLSWIVLLFGIVIIFTVGLRQINRLNKHRADARKYCDERECKTMPITQGLEQFWRLTTKPMDDALKDNPNHNGVLEPDEFNHLLDQCRRDHYKPDSECYVVPRQPRKSMYRLALHNFYIRSSFNTCAVSRSLTNTFVDVGALKTAIRTGFRFLDFEVCAKRGEPVVALFDNRTTITRKSSYNDIPLQEVLRTIVTEGLQKNDDSNHKVNHRDPLIIHLRIRTKITDVVNKIARYLRKHLAPYLMRAHELYVLGRYDDVSVSGDMRQSPFNVPIENLVYNRNQPVVIVVLYDGSQLDAFKEHSFRKFIENSELGLKRHEGSFEPLYHAWSQTYDATVSHGYCDLNIINNNDHSKENMCKQKIEDEAVDKMYMLCPPLYDYEVNKGANDNPCKTCSENEDMQKYDALVSTINDNIDDMIKMNPQEKETTIFRPNIVPVQLHSLVKNETLFGKYNRFFSSYRTGDHQRPEGRIVMTGGVAGWWPTPKQVRVSFKQKVFKTTRYEYQPQSFSTKNSYGRHSVKSQETILRLEGRVKGLEDQP